VYNGGANYVFLAAKNGVLFIGEMNSVYHKFKILRRAAIYVVENVEAHIR
jgi:hypothetical protein